MRIKIDDGMQCAVGTGIGKYTQHLADALSGKADVTLDSFCPDGARTSRRLAYLRQINSRAYRRASEQFDLLHFTNYAIPFRRSKKVKYATTVHDLTAILYPWTLPFLYRIYAKATLRHAIKRADLIFTVSQSVKREIAEKFPRHAHKVCAVYPGVYREMGASEPTVAYDDARLGEIEGKPFFLCVGTLEKRKNPGMVISSFFSLRRAGKLPDCKLVFAGRDGYGAQEYHDMVNRSPYAADVIFTGYVSNNDINRLYEQATACVFSTHYEGFGSTQLECMAHGLPLILSDVPTNREISGEYGRFFDLADPASLESLMVEALEQPDTPSQRAARIAKTKELLATLDWQRLAPDYLKAYESVL